MNKSFVSKSLLRWLTFLVAIFFVGYAVIAGGLVWSQFYWSSLVVGIIFFGGIFVWRIKSCRGGIPCTGLEIGLFFYLTVVVVSMTVSSHWRDGLALLALLFLYIAVFYLILDLFDAGLDTKSVITALVGVTGILNLWAVLETYFRYRSWWREIGSVWITPPLPYRFVGLIRHPNAMMALVNVISPFTIVMWQRTRKAVYRILLIYWWIFYLLVIPWSSSRGGMLGIAVWISVLVALQVWDHGFSCFIKRYWEKRTFVQRILLLVVFLGLLILVYSLWAYLNSHPSHGGGVFGSRSAIWENAFAIWRSSVLLGVGPGRFGFEYARHASIPPRFWAFYAHSLPFQTLAELGILGLLALGILLFLIALKLFRIYSSIEGERRFYLQAAISGLTAFSVHSLVDDFTLSPAVMLLTVIVLAVALRPKGNLKTWRWPHFTWAIPVMAMIFVGSYLGWIAWAYQPLKEAISAADKEDWVSAVSLAEKSLSRDPKSAFYNIEAGLAYGRLWGQTGDDQDLALAREYLHNGLRREPVFSIYYADLAVLEWQAGDTTSALLMAQRAVSLAPQEPAFALLEGWFLEQMGESNAAKQAYIEALKLEPGWGTSPFWEQTALRREIGEQCDESVGDAHRNRFYQRAWLAYQVGNWESAQQWLTKGKWAGVDDLDYWVLSGLIAEVCGDEAKAMSYYQQLAKVMRQRQWIVDDGYYRDFNIGAYRRDGFYFDLVPGFLQLEPDVGQYDALIRLREWYQEDGQPEKADQIDEYLETISTQWNR